MELYKSKENLPAETLYNNNNNNNEILIMRKPPVYARALCAVQKRKRKKKGEKKRLGQYNSNSKLIHGQYTSRYNLHLTLSLSPSPSLYKGKKIRKKKEEKVGAVQ